MDEDELESPEEDDELGPPGTCAIGSPSSDDELD